jgi:hypothetical protein
MSHENLSSYFAGLVVDDLPTDAVSAKQDGAYPANDY